MQYLAVLHIKDLVDFARTGDYKASFGASEEEIYDEWHYWLIIGV